MLEIAEDKKKLSNIEAELYLLIAKFLSIGPCTRAAEVLRQEIEEHDLLPKRVDWLGNEHSRSFNELNTQLSQIADDHLLKICTRIGPILDKEIPTNVPGLTSLLGVGRQSLLRTKEELNKPKCQITNLMARKNGMPLFPPPTSHSSYPPNISQVLISRELSGGISCRHAFSPKIYARQQMYRRLLGHLSSVYCVLFDRTGKYIFTGADDLLVKIWSATDGRLLAALRGHSAEITDMAVNYENTLLAAGSCDKTIRVWCLRTTAPVAVLNGHTAMVTSLQFCPFPKNREQLLISTGNDGCICFWQWNSSNNAFNPKPLKFTERNKPGAQMICSTFSPGGLFLATGSTDHFVRVYNIAGVNGPEKILEKEAHMDRVDSLQFSNLRCRFISGSKDGTALIWKYEKQNWSSIQLKMSAKLPGQTEEPEDSKLKLRVTMVGWTLDDSKVITAVSDHSIKVWNSNTGVLCYILKGHEDEVFVLESHPIDPRVFLSSGHDGRIIIWDLLTGTIIKNHFNLIEGQGHGAVFDCKFSPDGLMFASTDSHGHLSMFGFGSNDRYKKVPEEQFFHTDYRPLIRDIHHHVLDEQTQTAPHLLPPPFLVDIDGNPYPPHVQRLVPGREYCNDSQLIPYVAVSAEGEAEILEPVRSANDGPADRPTIDDMIERLQQEQSFNHGQVDSSNSSSSRSSPSSSLRSPHSSRRLPAENGERSTSEPFSPRTPRSQAGHSRVGLRRTGDVEGVQSVGNWQSRGSHGDLPAWVKRVVVRPMSSSLSKSHLNRRTDLADYELNFYNKEKKTRPLLNSREEYKKMEEKDFRRRQGLRAGLRSRTEDEAANSINEEENENPDQMDSSSDSESEHSDTTEDSNSGEYSDWIEDVGLNIKSNAKGKAEPKPSSSGTSTRPGKPRKPVTSSGDETDEDEAEKENDEEDEASSSMNRSSSFNGTRRNTNRKSAPSRIKPVVNGKKLPERFRPPEWLTDVMPHKVPFVPQIGDEIVYFRQGHELYVQAVKRNRIYDIYTRSQPWRKINLRDQEVAVIEDISFENHPPHLCCLKLRLLNPANKHDDRFSVKYHDMPDVIDFIVLKQYYDQAMHYDWKPGDRFRSAIDKAWWLGTILSQKPLNPNFPDSMFQCFFVKWDNGEKEHMSPWDFEPIDNERLPEEEGGSVDITPEEQLLMMYFPDPHEWSSFGQNHDCDRLARGLNRIMELSIAEPFVHPVDLNQYPSYAIVVEYPMDLGTIKARMENRFYRRLDAVKFDIRYILINAKKFNEPSSRIVKQAKCVVYLCLRFLENSLCSDPMTLYHEMMEAKQSRSQDSQSELDVLCSESDSEGEHTAMNRMKRKKQSAHHQSGKRVRLGSQKYTSQSWKQQCSSLLDRIILCDDSTPFRHPVNLNEYPDYRNIIDCPMDLSTVRDKLSTNRYDSPTDFCKDMRLIFQNSRNYNTNKKSRLLMQNLKIPDFNIYSMTIRLSAMFEEHIRGIVSDWRSAVKYEDKIRNNQYVSNRRKPLVLDADVNVGASTSRVPSTSLIRRVISRQKVNPASNATFHKSSTSKTILNNKFNSQGSPVKSKLSESQSSKNSAVRVKKKYLRNTLGSAVTNGTVRKTILRATKRKIKQKTSRKCNGTIRKKESPATEDDQSDSYASNPSNASERSSASDGSEWGRNVKRRRKESSLSTSKRLRPRVIAKYKPQRFTRSTSLYHQSPRSSVAQSKPTALTRHRIHTTTLKRKRWLSMNKRPVQQHNLSPLHTRSKSLPSQRTRSMFYALRKNTIKPQKYQSSPDESESEASESQSSKCGRNSNNSNTSSSKNTNQRADSSSKSQQSSSYSEPEENSEEEKISRFTRASRSKLKDDSKSVRSALSAPKSEMPKKLSGRIQTRNRGQRTVRYAEANESEEDEDSENPEGSENPVISFSSRGRLRSPVINSDLSKLHQARTKKIISERIQKKDLENITKKHSSDEEYTLSDSNASNLDNTADRGKVTHKMKSPCHKQHLARSLQKELRSKKIQYIIPRRKERTYQKQTSKYKWNLRTVRKNSTLSLFSNSKTFDRDSSSSRKKTTQHPDIIHVKRKYSENEASALSSFKSDNDSSEVTRSKNLESGNSDGSNGSQSFSRCKSQNSSVVKKWFLRSTPEEMSDAAIFMDTGSKSNEKFYEIQTRHRGQRTVTYEENIDEIYSKENYEDENSGLFCNVSTLATKNKTNAKGDVSENSSTGTEGSSRKRPNFRNYQNNDWSFTSRRNMRTNFIGCSNERSEQHFRGIQTRNRGQRTVLYSESQSFLGLFP